MPQMTLRTKFIAAFVALLVLTSVLAFASVHAMNSLNSELDRVVHRMWTQADRTSQLAGTLAELAGYQQAILLRSVLSDTAGVEHSQGAAADAESRVTALFSEIRPTLDSAQDRQRVSDLQSKAAQPDPSGWKRPD